MAQADRPQIMLFMQTEVLSGSIFISTPEGRLLDELNGRFDLEPENQDKFLELNDLTILHTDDTEEKVALGYINKNSIQMAAITNNNLRRGIGAQPDNKKLYPFIEKEMVRVKIDMSAYSVTGNIHRLSHQKVVHVLKERTEFMPVTHAEVYSVANGKRWYMAFLAVNKNHILALHE
jgi:hypothetical protein